MKKLILVLVFAVTAAFAQRGPAQHSAPAPHQGPPPHQFTQPMPQQRPMAAPVPQQGWSRFGQPGQPGNQFQRPFPGRPPMRPPIVIQRPIYVHPYLGFGYYSWGMYYDWGFWPYYPWYYGPSGAMVYKQPQPCKKEKLKDSDGKKHEVLVCVQPDGSTQVVADANTLVPAPAK